MVLCNFPLMSGGNKNSYVPKQTCSFYLQVCLTTYGLLLPTSIKKYANDLDIFTLIFWNIE